MVIIDKRKDCYDYLQGVIGKDPKAVYDRRGGFCFGPDSMPPFMRRTLPSGVTGYMGSVRLVCGNTLYCVYVENFGSGPVAELVLSHRIRRTSKVPMRICFICEEWKETPFDSAWARRLYSREACRKRVIDNERLFAVAKNLATEDRVPDRRKKGCVWIDNPILATLPVRLAPAEEIFLNLQEFILSLNDVPVEDNRTDLQKLESKGFDRRTSFRNVKDGK